MVKGNAEGAYKKGADSAGAGADSAGAGNTGIFVERPNLPDGPVCLAAADGRIPDKIAAHLNALGVELVGTHRHEALYEAVAYHPDMQLHHLGGGNLVYAPGTDEKFLNYLIDAGYTLIRGETVLRPEYPYDIAYNAARVGGIYFHNTRYTDPVL
jgi:hypothetical protein